MSSVGVLCTCPFNIYVYYIGGTVLIVTRKTARRRRRLYANYHANGQRWRGATTRENDSHASGLAGSRVDDPNKHTRPSLRFVVAYPAGNKNPWTMKQTSYCRRQVFQSRTIQIGRVSRNRSGRVRCTTSQRQFEHAGR